ncbi:efflux RND transporter periplasmic adaptor subunit [Vibrio sp. YMD68]|uniref:efflux RND transporter periplasmic adaptor subunit n=1 Tax=Vibrio sp. YMD68 TaxID=3042300 RepID=UPI00249BEBD5|nr:efflux RND transporter periplasmic adaptor subunit [Vibrio sp. YMD68]WGV98155.1 efflux RND transporter periplasmic adaptor subunit [Vibrio sp. YMD68]
MKSKNKWLGVILFTLLTMLFLYMAGMFNEKVSDNKRHPTKPETAPETIVLAAINEPVWREFSGVVVAKQRADISARITAKVSEIYIEVGEAVEKGDILMRLENEDLEARVTQNEQALSGAQAKLSSAIKEYDRAKELLTRKLVSQSSFDNAESELELAKATFNQTQAALIESQTTREFSIITAPFSGLITNKPINVGDTAAPGNVLVSLYQPSRLQIQADIAESVLPHIHLGQEINVDLPTVSLNIPSNVSEMTPSADVNSRSYQIKLDVNVEGDVYPGMYAKIKVPVGNHDVLRLPSSAVIQVGQLEYVQIWDGESITRRLVQLGDDGRIRKGVVEGEQILRFPQN